MGGDHLVEESIAEYLGLVQKSLLERSAIAIDMSMTEHVSCITTFCSVHPFRSQLVGLFAGTQFDRPPRCEVCEELDTDCICPPPEPHPTPPSKQAVKLAIEKRKKEKLVTVIRGLAKDNDLATLLTKLKSTCGAGGTLKEDELEIQGEHLPRVNELLTQLGYKVR